jgi:hypothetical protein
MHADPEAGCFFERKNPAGSRTTQDSKIRSTKIIRILNQLRREKDLKHKQQWEKNITPGSAGLFHSKNVSPSDPRVSVRIVQIAIPVPYQYRYILKRFELWFTLKQRTVSNPHGWFIPV